ncbi:MAG: quinone-dependent dihydroorotate dehydrogenase [Chthoniobacterales bacterium]
MNFYSRLIRPALFRLDAEKAHHFTMGLLRVFSHYPGLISAFAPAKVEKSCEVFGINFLNPVGLAAGLDKNAVALPAWEALGFGFIEIGTVTALEQPGNPLPRLFRYPEKSALINRMGFNNDGAEKIAARLGALKEKGAWPRIPVGINIGKSKVTPLEDAPADYLKSFNLLYPFADYFVVNVSSPNTPGLRKLQDAAALRDILTTLRSAEKTGTAPKPILVKLAPDLEAAAIDEAVEMCDAHGASGFIATNTSLDHSSIPTGRDESGGLSGKPLLTNSTKVLGQVSHKTKNPVIASGGIMDAASAEQKFQAGAALVQIYTGFIYSGPKLISDIARSAPTSRNF